MRKTAMPTDRRVPRSALSAAIAQALCAGTGLGLAGPALAQQAEAQPELAPVIVTAQRREQDILDVPYNISAVSGDEIALRQTFDTPELLRGVAGVSMVDRGQRNAAVVSGIRIRGLNVDSAALGDYAVSAAATVSTYVDDTPLYANFLLKDIQRVEVLRGPQGTLYGSGSLGGTVRYVMNQPDTHDFSANVGASLSNVDGSSDVGIAGDITLNMPVSDTLAVRATLAAADYPGITDYVNLYVLDGEGLPIAPNGVLDPATQYRNKKDADDVQIWYGRIAARWEPSETFNATLSYFAQSDDVGGRRQDTPGMDGFGRPYRDHENGSIQLEPSTRDAQLTSLEMNIDFGFATLTSSTSYYDHKGDSTSENTGFYAHAQFLSLYYYSYPRPMASAVRLWKDRALIEELRLVSDTGGKVDYVVGLWYQDQDLFSSQDSYLRGYKRWWDAFAPGAEAAVTGDQDFLYRRDENFTDNAVYGELTWHVTDRVHLTGGVRWFDNESKNHTIIELPLWAGLFSRTVADFKSDENDTLFKGNVAVDVGDDDLVYATYSQGYRRGGSNAVPLEGSFAEDPAWQIYTADTVDNYEIGIKGTLGQVRYDLSAFQVDWHDPQLNTATSNWAFFAVMNGDEAESKGLELELSGNAGDHVTYGFGWAYTDATLTKDLVSPTGTLYQEAGSRLPGAPENTLNASLDWRTAVLGDKEFIAHVDGYYQSETRNAVGNPASGVFNVPLDSFQIWGTAFTLATDKWNASLWVKNIFNEEGVTGVFTELYMGTDPASGYFGNGAKDLISLPRTVGLSFNYSF
jgi:outer membrane receptor protein involved in Fe transport